MSIVVGFTCKIPSKRVFTIIMCLMLYYAETGHSRPLIAIRTSWITLLFTFTFVFPHIHPLGTYYHEKKRMKANAGL
jgi:hypothetical protein